MIHTTSDSAIWLKRLSINAQNNRFEKRSESRDCYKQTSIFEIYIVSI